MDNNECMLCEINHALIDLVHDKIDSLDQVNTEEMDHVIKMIKNLEEAIYYYTIVEAMGEGKDVSKITINTATHGGMDSSYNNGIDVINMQ